MRRTRQVLDETTCLKILNARDWGTLAVLGDEGYPYAVPLNYVLCDGHLYFHCAREGHKLDAIRACDKVSFCVVDRDEVIPETYSTHYTSVIVFGRAHIVTDDAEKRRAIEVLTEKLAPNQTEQARKHAVESDWNALAMLRVDIEHMSGKCAKGLLPKA